MIELAEWFAPSLALPSSSSSPVLPVSPSFVVEGEWVEIPLILAAEANDVAFVAFLLARYAPRLRVALGSGRMLGDVLLCAMSARDRGIRCYWPVLELLLWYVDERRPVRSRRGGRGGGEFEEDLLEKMLWWGMVQPCVEHGCGAAGGGVVVPGSPCCFLWMMHLAVFKRMVRFVGVSKEELEDWIARLPWHLQGEVYDLLVKVNGCPLLWEETEEE
jgi:hypothetical protein